MPKRINPFQLLVKPAGFQCNLRCGYCFYLKTKELYPEPGPRLMSEDTAERMIKNYLSLNFPAPVFIWQGGEPSLCGLEFFERAVELEKKFGGPGQIIGNAFQSNGVLIDQDWCEFFARNRFLVGLSMDGPKELHDSYRRDRAGGSSFDQVWDAGQMLRRQGVEFNVLCMVTRANAGKAREIARFFRQAGFRYLQFIPAFDLDPETGRLAGFAPRPEQLAEFLVELFQWWWPEREAISIRDFDWLAAPGLQGRLCVFSESCAPYLAVEHNGDVYPCDFYVRAREKLGNIGEARAGFAELFRRRERAFSPRKKWLSRACRACPWLRFCFGGCLREREAKDSPDPKKSIYCPAYSALFETAFNKIRAG